MLSPASWPWWPPGYLHSKTIILFLEALSYQGREKTVKGPYGPNFKLSMQRGLNSLIARYAQCSSGGITPDLGCCERTLILQAFVKAGWVHATVCA